MVQTPVQDVLYLERGPGEDSLREGQSLALDDQEVHDVVLVGLFGAREGEGVSQHLIDDRSV